MTLKDIVQNAQREDLHVDSEHRLVSNNGWMIFGKEKYGPFKGQSYITVMDTTDGYGTQFSFHQDSAGALWYATKSSRSGTEEKEIIFDDMNDGVRSLRELGMNCGPLMTRAISAIAIQHNRAIRIGESLMTTAMRRAGLSVSDDGNVQDARSIVPNTRSGRS